MRSTENWYSTYKDLGNLKEEQKVEIIFKSKTSLNIKKISSSCGCSSVKYDKDSFALKITYKPKKVPSYKRFEGSYIAMNSATVYYENGTKERLLFKATITI